MRNREKEKCKKGQESTIGKIIYGFLLFMPLLAIVTTCLYAIFNKNAYLSYTKGMTEKITQINTYENIQEGKIYEIIYEDKQINSTSPIFRFSDLSFNFYDKYPTAPQQNYDGFLLTGSSNQIYWYYGNSRWTGGGNFNETTFPNGFSFTASATPNTNPFTNFNLYTITYQSLTIDKVFYTAVDKVEQSNLFNWATNSIIYTGISNTCTQLSITNTFIPLLLSYWLIISVLYFLYDIALMLVWIVHRKIHEMQESI